MSFNLIKRKIVCLAGLIVKLLSPLVIVCFTIETHAISFVSLDPRSMAMGGAGVASNSSYNAALFNPALLSGENFNSSTDDYFIRANAGARLIDRDDFLDRLENYQDNDSDRILKESIDDFNLKLESKNLTSADLHDLTQAGRQLVTDIQNLSDRPVRAIVSYSMVAGKSSSEWGIAAYSRRYTVAGGRILFTKEDRLLLQAVFDFTSGLADTLELTETYADLIDNNYDVLQSAWESGGTDALIDELTLITDGTDLEGDQQTLVDIVTNFETIYTASEIEIENVGNLSELPELLDKLSTSVELEGSVISENGISFSRAFENTFISTLGFTLKEVKFETLAYLILANDVSRDDLDRSDISKTYRDFNLDLGITKNLNDNWNTGFVVMNIIPEDYRTVRGNEIHLRPLVRAGLAYEEHTLSVAMDADLTSNDPVGFDPDKRYIALGAESRFFRRFPLRAGIRQNMVNNTQLYSAGVGYHGRYGFVDFAVAGEGDARGLSLQLGMRF